MFIVWACFRNEQMPLMAFAFEGNVEYEHHLHLSMHFCNNFIKISLKITALIKKK